jgi:HTH-type transcriptional regulator/antitoxin HigA
MTADVDFPALTEYRDLLLEIEPRAITSEEQAEAYRELIDILTDRTMSDGQRDMVGLLGRLVADWEEEHEGPIAVTPQDVVRFLLEENGLPQSALVPSVFPTRPGVSAFLSGRRPLTYDRAAKLAAFFNLSPAAFYPRRAVNEASRTAAER